MHDGVGVGDERADRLGVGEVAVHGIDLLGPSGGRELGPAPHEHRDVVALVEQAPHEAHTDIPGPPDHRAAHAAILVLADDHGTSGGRGVS